MQSSNRPVALVTGASSGIGAALARELARQGHDLVLSARSLAPMEALAEELRGLGAAATIIPADLAERGAAAALVREIAAAGLEIEVLVNNGGLGAIGRFDRADPVRNAAIMQVNIIALTELTRTPAAADAGAAARQDCAGGVNRVVSPLPQHGCLRRQQGLCPQPG